MKQLIWTADQQLLYTYTCWRFVPQAITIVSYVEITLQQIVLIMQVQVFRSDNQT